MRNASFIALIALVGYWMAPSLQAQDFLKQLEEKISQKQQETKAKESEAPPDEEGLSFPAPKLLEPEGLPAPNQNKEEAEGGALELPAPANRIEPPKKPAPRVKTPAPPKANLRPNSANTPAVPLVPEGGGGFLGMTVESATGGGFGLSVVEIAADSPAWKAGFRIGDRVIGVAGQAVTTVEAFADELAKYSPGVPVKFLVERRGRNANLIAVLQDRNVAGQIHGNRPGVAVDLAPPNSNMPGTAAGRTARAYFGVNVADMSDAFRRQFSIPAYRGASVTEVIPQSPAAAAGLKPGDCIVEMDGTAVQSAETVFDAIFNSKPGHVVTVSFYRGRQLNTASVPLIADIQEPSNPAAPAVTPEMLTPEYVANLHSELERVHSELSETQARLQQLEARLQGLENKR